MRSIELVMTICLQANPTTLANPNFTTSPDANPNQVCKTTIHPFDSSVIPDFKTCLLQGTHILSQQEEFFENLYGQGTVTNKSMACRHPDPTHIAP